MVKMVEQLISNNKVVGSTPTRVSLFRLNFFFKSSQIYQIFTPREESRSNAQAGGVSWSQTPLGWEKQTQDAEGELLR